MTALICFALYAVLIATILVCVRPQPRTEHDNVIVIKPGDRFIITTDRVLTMEQRERMHVAIDRFFNEPAPAAYFSLIGITLCKVAPESSSIDA
jgi:hypothetical protein